MHGRGGLEPLLSREPASNRSKPRAFRENAPRKLVPSLIFVDSRRKRQTLVGGQLSFPPEAGLFATTADALKFGCVEVFYKSSDRGIFCFVLITCIPLSSSVSPIVTVLARLSRSVQRPGRRSEPRINSILVK